MRTRITPWAALLVFAVQVGCAWADEPPKAEPARPTDKAKDGSGERQAAIPELPPEKLPPRTAPSPDPAKEQYRRHRVYLRTVETVEPKDKPAYTLPVRVLENYLAQYFRRAGFEVAREPDGVKHRIEGRFEAKFDHPITFQGQTLFHTYRGTARMSVFPSLAPGEGAGNSPGEPLEVVEVLDFLTDGVVSPGVPEEQVAVHEMRRRLARIIWERLFHVGKVFADREIPALIASLASDDPENEAPVLARDVLKALTARRFDAVPYLIEALTDDRGVQVHAEYPGLNSATREKLKIYHLADKALEEIFQRVSRMDLETTHKLRFAVIKGWENEWRKFCPSFRDSQPAEPSPGRPRSPRPGSGEAAGKAKEQDPRRG